MISGIAYTPFDEAGDWKKKILKELKKANYNIKKTKS